MFASEWFTTLFGYTFPVKFTKRVWTCFFDKGKIYLFHVSMAILKLLHNDILKLPFEKVVILLKSPPVTAEAVLEKAERFASITEEMYAKLKAEAEAHQKFENLLC